MELSGYPLRTYSLSLGRGLCISAVARSWMRRSSTCTCRPANELAQQAEAVNDGDLRRAHGMLIAQAHTLDAIFNNLARASRRCANA